MVMLQKTNSALGCSKCQEFVLCHTPALGHPSDACDQAAIVLLIVGTKPQTSDKQPTSNRSMTSSLEITSLVSWLQAQCSGLILVEFLVLQEKKIDILAEETTAPLV